MWSSQKVERRWGEFVYKKNRRKIQGKSSGRQEEYGGEILKVGESFTEQEPEKRREERSQEKQSVDREQKKMNNQRTLNLT